MKLSPNLVKILGLIAATSAAAGQSGALPPSASAIASTVVPALVATFLSVFGYAHK